MRLNWTTRVRVGDYELRPYTAACVPTYHGWMEDEHLRATTSSDLLSLEEEVANQASWVDDPDKLTFIVFSAGAGEGDPPPGMLGDVNLFLLPPDDGEDVAAALGPPPHGGACVAAEVMVMAAAAGAGRKGLATAAVRGIGAWAAEHLGVTTLVAKVNDDNAPSLNLFTSKLGFRVVKEVRVFGEVHLAAHMGDPVEWLGGLAYEEGVYTHPTG